MPSFRSIFLLASTALAAFTSAAPTPGGAPTNLNTGNLVGALTSVSDNNIADNSVNNNDVHVLGRRCNCDSIPDLFAHVQVEIDALTGQCQNVVNAGPIVDVNVAVDLVVKIQAILSAALADLQAIVQATVDVKVLLLSEGKLIDIQVCAQIIANVVIAIAACLKLVINACVNIDISAVLSVVAEIGGLLSSLLQIVFSVVADIDVVICGLLKVVVNVLVSVHLDVVVNLLSSVIKL